MSHMDAAGHDVDSPRREPGRHRREGNAQVAASPASFREEVWANPHGLLFFAVGGLLGVLWGGSTLLHDGPTWQRGLGLVAALAGALVWVSYFLRFQPYLLAGERWERTRPRRVMRAVLARSWAVFVAVAGLAWLIDLAFA